MPTPVVRFAPSPTGRIHIGNARTALLNYLYALRHGGQFILRFDDTDATRSTKAYADGIEEDLHWMGVRPDHIARQSEGLERYAAAAQKLKDMGLLYPAYETATELERRRKLKQARGLPPVYDRTALNLTPEDRNRLEAEGRKPHWRFQLKHETIRWHDLVRGDCHIDCASLSDPILIREDGAYLYTLPSVVDDIEMRITHIIRGEDHVTNTAVQLQLFEALAGEGRAPAFAHHNLLVDASGGGLSKRTGSLSLSSLREAGVEPLAIAAIATLTGTSDDVQAVASLEALSQLFDLGRISRNAAKFDPEELQSLTRRTLHLLDYDAVAERLKTFAVAGPSAEPFWLAVRGNLERMADVAQWWHIAQGEIVPIIEDAAFCQLAATLAPSQPWDQTTWGVWTKALKARSGRSGRALFHPLRLALTGCERGPELAAFLPLIGRERSLHRLVHQAEKAV